MRNLWIMLDLAYGQVRRRREVFPGQPGGDYKLLPFSDEDSSPFSFYAMLLHTLPSFLTHKESRTSRRHQDKIAERGKNEGLFGIACIC